ncbi:glycerol-3-phosphate acyltransferase, partial [Gardnerella leopoldii]|nr:glycerol-3-phosphate acyltransferase [Gardnerella leopoldii]
MSFAGLGVVLGHSFPFWNHFKGGKGVAVTALWIVFFDWRAGLIALLIGLFLVIIMKNLTIPPLVYMLGFSIFTWLNFGWEQGLIFLIATLIMIFQFRKDIVDFFTGHGKRVDVLV